MFDDLMSVTWIGAELRSPVYRYSIDVIAEHAAYPNLCRLRKIVVFRDPEKAEAVDPAFGLPVDATTVPSPLDDAAVNVLIRSPIAREPAILAKVSYDCASYQRSAGTTVRQQGPLRNI